MSTREEILARLRAGAREAAAPAPWQSQRHFADLSARFAQALTAAGGEIHLAADRRAALETVASLFQELAPRRVVANDEPPLAGHDHAARWPEIEWFVPGQTSGDLRAFCETADIGLSGADAALAETGTLIVSSGPGRSRLATLLPPVHIALLPADRLTSDLFTWTAARQGDLPANTILISGPSKSADIEQTMAVGVHGPTRFIVILFQP